MSAREFVLWGLMPDCTPIKIAAGTPAECRREAAVRMKSTYWRGLRVYAAGTPYPVDVVNAYARGVLTGA